MSNPNGNNEIAKNQKYIFFAERVWNDEIKKNWLPLLLTSNLLSEQQQLNIEAKTAKWKEHIGSSSSYLVYGIIALLALLILGSLYFVSKRKKNRVEEIANSEIDEEIEIELGASNKSNNDGSDDDT